MKIDTPEEMVARMFPDSAFPLSDLGLPYRAAGSQAISARDEQIAAWCEAKADEASARTETAKGHLTPQYFHGQADVYRQLARSLRGGR